MSNHLKRFIFSLTAILVILLAKPSKPPVKNNLGDDISESAKKGLVEDKKISGDLVEDAWDEDANRDVKPVDGWSVTLPILKW